MGQLYDVGLPTNALAIAISADARDKRAVEKLIMGHQTSRMLNSYGVLKVLFRSIADRQQTSGILIKTIREFMTCLICRYCCLLSPQQPHCFFHTLE